MSVDNSGEISLPALHIHRQVRKLANDAVGHPLGNTVPDVHLVHSGTNPVEIEAFLKVQAFGAIMLADGEPFGIPGMASEGYPDANMAAGETMPSRVFVRIKRWESKEPHHTPRTKPWWSTLDIVLQYQKEDIMANQSIGISATSASLSVVPPITRELFMSSYAESGYEGHGREEYARTTVDDVRIFMDAFQKIVRE